MDATEQLVWMVFFIAVYCGVNLALAMFVDKKVRNFWLWFIMFCLAPVLAHIFCIIFLLFYLPKQRSKFTSSIDNPATHLIKQLQSDPEEGVSVTPFGSDSDTPAPNPDTDTESPS